MTSKEVVAAAAAAAAAAVVMGVVRGCRVVLLMVVNGESRVAVTVAEAE